ncbi:MAG: hypothetical protein R3335_15045 [Anaerolineales bacterium]|nr:hypothetical protein [Anaerolineales bacterium]
MNKNRIIPIVLLILVMQACNLPGGSGAPNSTAPATGTPARAASPTTAPEPPEMTATPSPIPGQAATVSPTAEVPAATEIPEGATAEVHTNAFCREGPGTVYRDITAFTAGTVLAVNGVDPGQTWWRVAIPGSGGSCWISGILLNLNGDLGSVPELTPPPTPFRPPSIDSSAVEGATIGDYDNFFFDDEESGTFFLRIYVHNTDVGANDGDGIASVRFQVTDSSTGEVVRDHTENLPGYCIFGGGEPGCNPWIFEDGAYRWESGGEPIRTGEYRVWVIMELSVPVSGSGGTVDWIANYQISAP